MCVCVCVCVCMCMCMMCVCVCQVCALQRSPNLFFYFKIGVFSVDSKCTVSSSMTGV